MLSALAIAVFCSATRPSADWPLTRAERSNYDQTSSYDDVIEFVKALQAKGSPITLTWSGESTEKRKMPLVVVAYPPVTTPGEAKKSGKPVVYVQGNIHAGEVEGKEAAQMLLRRVCQEIEEIKAGRGKKEFLADKLVLLVNPIYNADGNEKWAPVERNRPEQVGPKEVGIRANGQGFDLNRDCIKAESPEMRGVLQHVYGAWDPDMIMDLHTTDGTRHGYDLTYSPALNPNTDAAILKFSRDEMLPFVRKEVGKKYGYKLFDYGDITTRNGKSTFATFASEGRYVTNYGGIRNRICVLSEAVTYIPFKDRVLATDKFVSSVLEYVARNGARVVKMTKDADAKVVAWGSNPGKAPKLGVRFDFDSRGEEEVVYEKPIRPRPFGRPTELMTSKMPIIDRFKVTRTADFPAGYLVPESNASAVELMRRHGIKVERLMIDWDGPAQSFTISEKNQDASPFQGHRLLRLEGKFSPANVRVPAGTLLVRTAQPLGLLAFHLLEPEMTDGLATWGFLGEKLDAGNTYPVLKLMTIPNVPLEALD